MSRIILFSGTSEGRQLSEALEKAGTEHLVCVATRTGSEVMRPGAVTRIHEGRLDEAGMEDLVHRESGEILGDATHPYATEVSKTIRSCAKALSLRYLRVVRADSSTGDSAQGELPQGSASHGETSEKDSAQGDLPQEDRVRNDCQQKPAGIYEKAVCFFSDAESCRNALLETEGNILLTTGSKQLSFFGAEEALRGRLFARVLPTAQSLQMCEDAGIGVKNIIAMFGPFTEEMNTAMLAQYNIRVMVTKETGSAGGISFIDRALNGRLFGAFVICGESAASEQGVMFRRGVRYMRMCYLLE